MQALLKKIVKVYSERGLRGLYEAINRKLKEAIKREMNWKRITSGRPSDLRNFLHRYQGKKIVILTTQHCHFVAKLISSKLEKVSIESEIIFSKPKNGFEDCLHIVICPNMFSEMPSHYFAYQMEQSVSSRWFNKDYFSKLHNAIGVMDYSMKNVKFLQEKGFHYRQLFYVPIFSNKAYSSIENSINEQDKYDVLFYGDASAPRRAKVLNRLNEKFRVKTITNLFGEELYKEIAKAKIVLNLHYYEGALLETCRIFELLSLGKVIVSEESSDQDEHSYLSDLVNFVQVDNYEQLESCISSLLENADKIKQQEISIAKKLSQQFDSFEFYFFRMLLAFDLISFDQFYYTIGQKVNFEKNYICLSLKETIKRTDYFRSVDKQSAHIFPGLRHYKGWVGCGLSYKFLMLRCKQQGFSFVTVCEDDVVFEQNFFTRYENIMTYLQDHADWDIFAGLIADYNPATKILKVVSENGEKYAYIDKMTSTVFNVYSERMYDRLIMWDSNNHNADTNTIDRFIQRMNSIRVLSLPQYLVGHAEELDSSLWDFKNSTYNLMIEKSQERFQLAVSCFESTPTQLQIKHDFHDDALTSGV